MLNLSESAHIVTPGPTLVISWGRLYKIAESVKRGSILLLPQLSIVVETANKHRDIRRNLLGIFAITIPVIIDIKNAVNRSSLYENWKELSRGTVIQMGFEKDCVKTMSIKKEIRDIRYRFLSLNLAFSFLKNKKADNKITDHSAWPMIKESSPLWPWKRNPHIHGE